VAVAVVWCGCAHAALCCGCGCGCGCGCDLWLWLWLCGAATVPCCLQRDAAVAQQKTLEVNISRLYATAVTEIKRKDRMIAELRSGRGT